MNGYAISILNGYFSVKLYWAALQPSWVLSSHCFWDHGPRSRSRDPRPLGGQWWGCPPPGARWRPSCLSPGPQVSPDWTRDAQAPGPAPGQVSPRWTASWSCHHQSLQAESNKHYDVSFLPLIKGGQCTCCSASAWLLILSPGLRSSWLLSALLKVKINVHDAS